MKQILLFALLISIAVFGYAQSNVGVEGAYKVNPKPPTHEVKLDVLQNLPNVPVNPAPAMKGTAILSKKPIGSSANIYTALVENQSCLDVNIESGALTFTHRANPNDIGASSGDIIVSYSDDEGASWASHLVLSADATHANRYPSGVIYNPTGNTTASDAYVVYCGPSHDNGNWDKTYFGSVKLDGTGITNTTLPSYGALIRMGLVEAAGDFHVMGSAYQDSPYKLDTAYMYNGTWNSANNAVDWSVSTFNPNFIIDSASGDAFAYVWNFNSAWSIDGKTGYYWTIGRDSSNDTRSYQPIIWKSTDSGASWTKMPVFDFSTVPAITAQIRPVSGPSGITRPMFSSALDGVVDGDGNLHLIGIVKGASNDNNDSLGYSWYYSQLSPPANPVMDVFMTSSGGWDAKLLGKVFTVEVDDASSQYGTGSDAIGWDHRVQAGRSADGTKIFASWADTDTTLAALATNGLMMNSYPNLFVYGYEISTGNTLLDKNLTTGTDYDSDNHFHYMSKVILEKGSEYIVPLTTTDIWTNSDPLQPVYHYYLSQSFTGINSPEASHVDVSQNMPNPFTGVTRFDVRLSNASTVLVDVVSMTGQKVASYNYGTMNGGMHTLSIDATSFAPGVYFYVVQAGNKTVTKKMVVE